MKSVVKESLKMNLCVEVKLLHITNCIALHMWHYMFFTWNEFKSHIQTLTVTRRLASRVCERLTRVKVTSFTRMNMITWETLWPFLKVPRVLNHNSLLSPQAAYFSKNKDCRRRRREASTDLNLVLALRLVFLSINLMLFWWSLLHVVLTELHWFRHD